MEKAYFPLFVDLSGKRILAAGAGKIAARRVKTLTEFARDITVVAPEFSPELEALAAEGRIVPVRRRIRPEDLEGADLVLAATDSREVNGQICDLCAKKGIPVNVIDDPGRCSFFFPGVVKEGSLVVGVTASGTDHKKARSVTQAIRELLHK